MGFFSKLKEELKKVKDAEAEKAGVNDSNREALLAANGLAGTLKTEEAWEAQAQANREKMSRNLKANVNENDAAKKAALRASKKGNSEKVQE